MDNNAISKPNKSKMNTQMKIPCIQEKKGGRLIEYNQLTKL